MITRISIKEQVYEYLKKGVVEGKLQPGMVYSEQMIADTLHVSRTPVREAIQLLRHENLVEVYSNRGFGVKDICAADIEEIIQARLAIEGFGVRLLARQYASAPAQDTRRQLQKTVEDMKKIKAGKKNHYLFTQADVSFHRLLVQFTNNPYLMQVSDMIQTKQAQATVHSLQEQSRMDQAVEEHERILSALATGEEEEAVHAFEYHMQVTRQILHAESGLEDA
ncbi:GntR family transcriptional regulator [Megasphaera hominis]|uniref:GntR family transcriptional regulator n=1 Tax=Megasphaera hominis TaxID=159836 RepID=A0ABR6VJQ8_9FIRM|nr:GntR family transcriptional regulator [uncultured Megasphaera sp.]MBC3536970.1 GntR family transcriptional regulator [Megasphaera hominis]